VRITLNQAAAASPPMLRRRTAALLGITALFILIWLLWPRSSEAQVQIKQDVPVKAEPSIGNGESSTRVASKWSKPVGIKIVGLVFCEWYGIEGRSHEANGLSDGREKYASILNCYLQKNLAVNGGFLDEVHFLANTDVKSDLDYLDHLLASTPSYKRIDVHWNYDFARLWKHAVDHNTFYLKMDDDIVSSAGHSSPSRLTTAGLY
jgi:hypothetical protein